MGVLQVLILISVFLFYCFEGETHEIVNSKKICIFAMKLSIDLILPRLALIIRYLNLILKESNRH